MRRSYLMVAIVFALGFVFQSYTTGLSGVDPVGTWTYKAPTAPEGYGSGDIVIAKGKEAFTVALKFGDYESKATAVKYEKEVLSFKVYLEGEYINIKATFSANGLKGTASYSEGDIAFTAAKKVAKK
jgi:hypothetical protein